MARVAFRAAVFCGVCALACAEESGDSEGDAASSTTAADTASGEEESSTAAEGGSCEYPCPPGTAFSTMTPNGIDVAPGYDPSTFTGEGYGGPYMDGDCVWWCELIQPCPATTFPVITEDCFTCATVVTDEEGNPTVVQGSCE